MPEIEIEWDKANSFVYKQMSKENFEAIHKKYLQFRSNVHDANTEPNEVYNPLSKRALEELQLIREVSQYLQKKKDDEINKAKADAEAAEAAAENKEDSKEEENTKEVTESEEKPES